MNTGTQIVIADDNAEIRQLLTDTLTSLGYQTDAVSDGYELLSYMEGKTPALIILDMMMPEKSGASIFNTLKQMSPYTRIIIYTGHSDYENSVYARSADRFLIKGRNIMELIKAVKELV
jgi:CheY-like chemotaxis protein